MKRGLFIFGIGLVALAFVAAASEMAAHTLATGLGALVPMKYVWSVLSPETLEAARAWGREASIGGLWSIAEIVMWLPGWIVFGTPGFALIILFRDHDEGPDQAHEDGLFLYDELARAAREDQNLTAMGDDFAPTHPRDIEPADKSFADEHIEEHLLDDDSAGEQAPEESPAKTPDTDKP